MRTQLDCGLSRTRPFPVLDVASEAACLVDVCRARKPFGAFVFESAKPARIDEDALHDLGEGLESHAKRRLFQRSYCSAETGRERRFVFSGGAHRHTGIERTAAGNAAQLVKACRKVDEIVCSEREDFARENLEKGFSILGVRNDLGEPHRKAHFWRAAKDGPP